MGHEVYFMVEHLHLIVRAEVSKPLKEEQSAEDFLTNLINAIGMNPIWSCIKILRKARQSRFDSIFNY